MTPQEQFNTLLGHRITLKFKKRNMEAFYCPTKEDAIQKALEIVPHNSSIAWGGSQTLDALGLKKTFKEGPYTVYDRDEAKDPDEKRKLEFQGLQSDYFLMSTNAFTMDGKLVNIDGSGNRLAGLIYGPKNVLIFAGMNKMTRDEETAIQRVRSIAAPMNAIRLQTQTPCVSSGICHDCTTDDCICSQMVITRTSKSPGRIKVLLIGESLGF